MGLMTPLRSCVNVWTSINALQTNALVRRAVCNICFGNFHENICGKVLNFSALFKREIVNVLCRECGEIFGSGFSPDAFLVSVSNVALLSQTSYLFRNLSLNFLCRFNLVNLFKDFFSKSEHSRRLLLHRRQPQTTAADCCYTNAQIKLHFLFTAGLAKYLRNWDTCRSTNITSNSNNLTKFSNFATIFRRVIFHKIQ